MLKMRNITNHNRMVSMIRTVIAVLALIFSMQAQATEGAAIKVEFSGTSMTIELSQQPKIVTEDGKLVLKTSSMSLSLTLPCKVTPIGSSNTAIDKVVIRNNDENAPINVYSLDGKKVGTLKDKNEVLSLERGVYIINGKKVFIK